jgi:RING finger protein 113A
MLFARNFPISSMNSMNDAQKTNKTVMIKSRKKRGDTSTSRKRTRDELEDDDNNEESTVVVQSSSKKQQNSNVATTKKTTDDSVQATSSDKGFASSREMRKDDHATVETTNTSQTAGPTKRQSNVLVNSSIDFQPGICKDYYETGFCGYGDDCIFAHIREEWKSGWKLEKEWQDEQAKKKLKKNEEDNDSNKKKDDGLPHACFICRNEFVNPVVTNCKHYFCESCALKHFNGGKNPKCFACGEQTYGQFNTARAIIKKQKLIAEQQKQTERDFVPANE